MFRKLSNILTALAFIVTFIAFWYFRLFGTYEVWVKFGLLHSLSMIGIVVAIIDEDIKEKKINPKWKGFR